MADLDRVKRNIGRMISLNAPETDIDAYIESEGVTLDQVRAHKVGTPSESSVSRLESGARGAAQGATFGFADEIAAGLGAVGGLPFGDFDLPATYTRIRDKMRAGDKAAEDANPGTFLAGEVAGSVALPFGAAKAVAKAPGFIQKAAQVSGLTPKLTQTATFGQRAGQGARMGAAYGGLYGAGKSEGGSASEVAQDTATGAAGGLVLGAAAVPAIDAAAAVGRSVAAPIRNRIYPQAAAAEKVLEAQTRDMKAGPRLAARAQTAAAVDQDTMLADVGGKSTQRLLRAAQNQQSPQSEVLALRLDQRQKFQGNKIERGLRSGLKLGTDDVYQSIDDVTARLKTIGQQGFQPALATNTPITRPLANVLQRPEMADIVKRVTQDFATEGSTPTTTQILHRAKVELDEMIRATRKAAQIGADRTAGFDLRKYQQLKTDLLSNINNPAYKDALKLYADEVSLRSAAQEGMEDFLKTPWQDVRKVMKGLSQAEQTMYRRGAIQSVMERIRQGSPMNDKVKGVLGNDNMMARLRQLFDNQKDWRTFQKQLIVLERQAKTRAAAQGNSTTAQQLSDMIDTGQMADNVKTVANAATGNWRAVLDAAGRAGSRAVGMTPKVADETLRLLMKRPGVVSGPSGQSANIPALAGQKAQGALNTPELMAAMRRRINAQEKRDTYARGLMSVILGQQ